MIPNTDITIYNVYTDETARTKKYSRSVVKRVVWENRRGVNGLRSGALASNVANVLIPYSSSADHLDPKEWEALVSKTGKWTLRDGDIIVKGEVNEEIDEDFTLTMLKAAHNDVLIISSVDDMDQGSLSVRHWDVGAK